LQRIRHIQGKLEIEGINKESKFLDLMNWQVKKARRFNF
jgi:hypothetical protein